MAPALVMVILFLQVRHTMQAWLRQSTVWSTFCASADSCLLIVCSCVACDLEATVQGVSTATEYSSGLQAIYSFVVMN